MERTSTAIRISPLQTTCLFGYAGFKTFISVNSYVYVALDSVSVLVLL